MEWVLKEWLLGWDEQSALPSLRHGIAANFKKVTVPHNVQEIAFSDLDELFYADNLRSIDWTQEKAWIYKTQLELNKQRGKQYILYFGAVDYLCEFYVNAQHIETHEGMFGSVSLNVTDVLKDGMNEIWCVLYLTEDMRKRSLRHRQMKCQNSYGWDAAPTMLTMGLWDEVRLLERNANGICDYQISTELAGGNAHITIVLERTGFGTGDTLQVSFGALEQRFVLSDVQHTSVSFEIKAPTLWYPHTMGTPYLYDVSLVLTDASGTQIDEIHTQYGIRSLKTVHCGGQRPTDTPLQMVINDAPVFLKGVNMVPLEVFPAQLDAARYDAFITCLKEGNVNLVRVWGGGLVEKDYFYEACDRAGILVWQDFPQCCENPPEDEEYLALLAEQAEKMLRKLRNHCCVVLYAGGNELYVDWSRLKESTPKAVALTKEIEHLVEPFDHETFMAGALRYDEPALKLLGDLCRKLDSTRPYHISTPLEQEGEVHGPWGYDLQKGDQRYQTYPGTFYQFWNDYAAVLFSESGCSGMANLQQYKKIIPEAEQWPIVTASASMAYHKASGAAWNRPDQWLDMQMVEDYFGKLDSLEAVNWASQYLQAEGIRYIVEECRRKRPDCCGVFLWAVNETWPNAASLSLMDYDFGKRQAYFAMKNAFSPNIASLRYEALLYDTYIPCQIWLDAEQAGLYQLEVTFYTPDKNILYHDVLENVQSHGMPVKLKELKVQGAGTILCDIKLLGEHTDYRNTYCWGQRLQAAPLAPILP